MRTLGYFSFFFFFNIRFFKRSGLDALNLIFQIFIKNFLNLGAARGCGWQRLVVGINLGAYYMVGLPSGILFAFVFHLKEKVSLIFSFSIIIIVIL